MIFIKKKIIKIQLRIKITVFKKKFYFLNFKYLLVFSVLMIIIKGKQIFKNQQRKYTFG